MNHHVVIDSHCHTAPPACSHDPVSLTSLVRYAVRAGEAGISKTVLMAPPVGEYSEANQTSSFASNPTTQTRTRAGDVLRHPLPSLCRQPPRIRVNNGELSRMRIRRWRACTNKCELRRTGLQSLCKRAVVRSILDNGSTGAAVCVRGDLHFRRCQRQTA
jgi:hypothetical protein